MNKKRTLVANVVILICLLVFAFSAYKLYSIWRDYKEIDDTYAAIEMEFTTPDEDEPPAEDSEAGNKGEAEVEDDGYYEDEKPPVKVDWKKLKKKGKDVVGWIYIDATGVSYPIAQGKDNDQYLHHTISGDYLFAGTIFLSCNNSSDFSDANSIVYGHNMKNGSMFGRNKELKDQKVYDKHPYFWILTPNGNYRYHIYSVMKVDPKTEPYTLWKEGGKDFLKWEKRLQKKSIVKNDVLLKETDRTVTLSCCEPNHYQRTLIIGRCCSTTQPPAHVSETAEGGE